MEECSRIPQIKILFARAMLTSREYLKCKYVKHAEFMSKKQICPPNIENIASHLLMVEQQEGEEEEEANPRDDLVQHRRDHDLDCHDCGRNDSAD